MELKDEYVCVFDVCVGEVDVLICVDLDVDVETFRERVDEGFLRVVNEFVYVKCECEMFCVVYCCFEKVIEFVDFDVFCVKDNVVVVEKVFVDKFDETRAYAERIVDMEREFIDGVVFVVCCCECEFDCECEILVFCRVFVVFCV